MNIMCRGEIVYDEISEETGVEFRSAFEPELQALNSLEEDGLLYRDDKSFRVTDTGRLFLRNVAMVFDGYRQEKALRPVYSKTI
jgi:oxygen-independent coproporphyrinogen-3 oxidase